jgi:hypothetical protein
MAMQLDDATGLSPANIELLTVWFHFWQAMSYSLLSFISGKP